MARRLRTRPSTGTPIARGACCIRDTFCVQTSRRFYNANVRDYNQRVKQFPSVIIASAFNFEEGRAA